MPIRRHAALALTGARIGVSERADAVRGPQRACGWEIRRCADPEGKYADTPFCRSIKEIRRHAALALRGANGVSVHDRC